MEEVKNEEMQIRIYHSCFEMMFFENFFLYHKGLSGYLVKFTVYSNILYVFCQSQTKNKSIVPKNSYKESRNPLGVIRVYECISDLYLYLRKLKRKA